jgi:uncharacterized protein
MTHQPETSMTASFIALRDHQLCAEGSRAEVALAIRAAADGAAALVFDMANGRIVDLDLSGSTGEVAARYAPPPAEPRGRGRPKLGVTAREVTLLPRHWDWLATQPGGASAALRRLVDTARRDGEGTDRRRHAQDATYRVMQAVAGDLPGYEEALRALYRGDMAQFSAEITAWPADLPRVLHRLSAAIGETG